MWHPRDAGNTAVKEEIKRAKDNRAFILWIEIAHSLHTDHMWL